MPVDIKGRDEYPISNRSEPICGYVPVQAEHRCRRSDPKLTTRPRHLTRASRPLLVHCLCLAPELIFLEVSVR